eukprot:TRINITY_DN1030_c0_g1_i1.p1 TRINITY_DN1030_c0_g1~~TRINITY_DN1030_c0_g1_i1.p1  ORF type:complete len:280 (+),score=71.73 TRINITY_DN1030_c0_g1_i1:66-842(+)
MLRSAARLIPRFRPLRFQSRLLSASAKTAPLISGKQVESAKATVLKFLNMSEEQKQAYRKQQVKEKAEIDLGEKIIQVEEDAHRMWFYKDFQGGGMSVFPICEIQAGDISAYVPTNLISITDGQVIFSKDMFVKGYRPAINLALSVSRIGSSAQMPIMKNTAGQLKLDMSQFREIEAFAEFGTDLDPATLFILNKGLRVMELMKQPASVPADPVKQSMYCYFNKNDEYFNHLAVDRVGRYRQLIDLVIHLGGKSWTHW